MAGTERFSVAIAPELAAALRDSVAAGDYASAGEAVQEAVRLWQRQRAASTEQLKVIRERIRWSLADPDLSLSEAELDACLDQLFAVEAEEPNGASA